MIRMTGVLFSIGFLLAPAARADYCALVDQATADRAVVLIREAGTILNFDWFSPIEVQTVERRRDGRSFRVVVNGDVALDLAYAYIRDDQGFRHLGMSVDCDPEDWPAMLSAEPFMPAPILSAITPDPADRLIGLVGVPAITPWVRGAPIEEAGEIRLYDRPAVDAAVVDAISDWTDLPTEEYDYEVPGAIVHRARGGWYEVDSQGGRAWLSPSDAGPFRRYDELVRESLSYLSAAWDGRIYERPAIGAAGQAMDPGRRTRIGKELPVEVEEVRLVDDALWFRVEISWPSPCGGDEPRPLGRGWMRAYDPAGAPTVWFYSRGC